MLCVTGAERTLAHLRARLRRHREAELQEVRLDLLGEMPGSLAALGIDPRRVLITCRPTREGGGFQGSESERLTVIEKLVTQAAPGWVDLEAAIAPEPFGRLAQLARAHHTRVLASRHEIAPGVAPEAAQLVERLSATGANAIKLALAVNDAAELAALRSAGLVARLPAIVIGMGAAGLLSRALYPRFGSAWTYVAADENDLTAPGQLTLGDMRRFRLPGPPHAALYGLMGGEQVLRSPGPRVYNHLFARRGIEARYLPVVTNQPAATLKLLCELGLAGASVTRPLKRRVVAGLDELGGEAAEIKVVNTITVGTDGRLTGENTDGRGALVALEKASGSAKDKRVAVLGSGATAAAIGWALRRAGARVTLVARNTARAGQVAERIEVKWTGLDELCGLDFDWLVNATPVGADGATLVGDPRLLARKTVLDVVLANDTRLLCDTRAAGGTAVSGRALWAEQGRLQLRRWLGLDVSAAELERDP